MSEKHVLTESLTWARRFQGRHVALFLPSLAGGGAERMMLRLGSLLKDAGVKVDMVVCRAEGENLERLPAGLNLVNLDKRKPTRAIFALSDYLRSGSVEVLFSTLTHANYSAVLAARASATGVRSIVRDAASPVDDLLHDSFITRHLKSSLVRWLYPKAAARVALSCGVADGMHQAYGLARDSIAVIYNPVDADEIRQDAEKSSEHPWLQSPDQPPVLLSVGRLCYQKGFDLLLRAMAVAGGQRNFRLIILGEGPARDELEQLSLSLGLQDRVDLPGFLSNPHSLIAKSAGFIFSSRWEGLGNALVEAMCCGVPIVATDCPHGPAEVLEGGRHGLLIPPENVESMAVALTKLIEGQVASPQLEALDRFRPEHVRNQYLELFFPDPAER